jgi:ribosomal protein L11 methyltransferase
MLEPDQPLFVYEVEGLGPGEGDFPGEPSFAGCWVEGAWSFLFFTEPADDRLADLTVRQGVTLRARHELTYGQWQAGRELKPIKAGRVVVVPVGLGYRAAQGEAVVWMDPGLVFGTGLHPTTRLCLVLLERIMSEGAAAEVLDLGCGTGVLALAAARLGARRVWAVDQNPLCFRTTADNVARNQLAAAVEVATGDAAEWIARPADLVVANLTADLLLSILRPEALAGKKAVIVSGFLDSRAGQIARHLESHGWRRRARESEAGWSALAFTDPASGPGSRPGAGR